MRDRWPHSDEECILRESLLQTGKGLHDLSRPRGRHARGGSPTDHRWRRACTRM
jgi:hypothetical protein